MTDGAARLIETYGTDAMKNGPYKRLTSRDPKLFWTSGQWMTERPGGSDVGSTESVAQRDPDGGWQINGFKWFSSATDADMTMLLARVVDEKGDYTEGSRGLSLFFARIKDDHTHSKLNGVRIHRLKNKMGTKAVPTAELELDGMKAQLVRLSLFFPFPISVSFFFSPVGRRAGEGSPKYCHHPQHHPHLQCRDLMRLHEDCPSVCPGFRPEEEGSPPDSPFVGGLALTFA